MIEYMVARRIAAEVEGCLIANVLLPDWNIEHPAVELPPGPAIDITTNAVDIAAVARLLSSGEVRRVNLNWYVQRFSNFPDVALARDMFKANEDEYPGFGPEYLVCNVRGGEVLDARHEHYTLLPIEFYADLARMTGLQLVFLGQIEDNAYCDALKRRFPEAIFCESRGALADFQTFRNSHNLVPAISTFSWLSAWLSQAEWIALPVNGLFHPMQCPDINLLPYEDERYRFYLFPINYAVPVDRCEEAHRTLQNRWRYVRPETIAELSAATPRWPQRLDRYLAMFDEIFYLQAYPDVAAPVAEERMKVLDHYVNHGFGEQRLCFDFDHRWYSAEYPLAAVEVGQGDYVDLRHHFVEVGAIRGYKPLPPSDRIRWPRRLDRYLAMFDELFYLQAYQDVAKEVAAGTIKARDHYVSHGFKEQRLCFDFDECWYSAEYPLATSEVEQGHYADFRHHFVEVGAIRGYKPLPEALRLRWPRRLDRFVTKFDELFYLQVYPDVAKEVAAGRVTARDHYVGHGFKEQRVCFGFDENWYGTEYPLAVFEVEQGHFLDFRHHFVETGAARGYQPLPSPLSRT
jgi:hypothetical protein